LQELAFQSFLEFGFATKATIPLIQYLLLLGRFLGYGGDSDATAAPSKSKIVMVQAAGGIIAGATASSITTPLDTIKTRLQV